MKIRMTTSMTGINLSLSPGDEPDCFSDKEMQSLVDAGFAVRIDEEAKQKATPKASTKKAGQ